MNNNQTNEDKPKLSDGQRQKLKKYAVFALMGIICAGCMWFIFAPSAEDKAKREMQTGFNAEIPDPKNEGIVGDKATAYEQEQVKQKQAERMRSLDDFSSLLGENGKKQNDDLVLLPDETASPSALSKGEGTSSKPTPVQNSVNAYRDMNRNLGNFYEKPREDPEKERLKREMDELKNRMDEQERSRNAADEQLALMERSFQLAAKYMPGTAGTAASSLPGIRKKQTEAQAPKKATVTPVAQAREQAVSSLQPDMSGAEFIEMSGQPRNTGFLTATAELAAQQKNTVSACVHDDQTLMDGQNVRLRLLEAMQVGERLVPRNTLVTGTAKIQGERLEISIRSMEHEGTIIRLELTAYDTDGLRGIFIPDMQEVNAAKEIVANMGTSAGTSINLSNDAGKQLLADMGRNTVQGVSQLAAKKLREVKVHLKAGHRIWLLPNEQ